jgi:NtrC-family two-component system response regulator AlgB
VAATNRDIEDDIAKGRFRGDLFFRLNVIEVRLPPMRERPEDILPLAQHFIETVASQVGCPVPHLSKRAVDSLKSYSWPGNVRELKNTIERAVILWPTDLIEPEAFPERQSGARYVRPLVGGDYTVDDVEQEHILRVIHRAPTLAKAAEILGIDYTTLWRKRKRYLSDLADQGLGVQASTVDMP